jgi:hypothetical protein
LEQKNAGSYSLEFWEQLGIPRAIAFHTRFDGGGVRVVVGYRRSMEESQLIKSEIALGVLFTRREDEFPWVLQTVRVWVSGATWWERRWS